MTVLGAPATTASRVHLAHTNIEHCPLLVLRYRAGTHLSNYSTSITLVLAFLLYKLYNTETHKVGESRIRES